MLFFNFKTKDMKAITMPPPEQQAEAQKNKYEEVFDAFFKTDFEKIESTDEDEIEEIKLKLVLQQMLRVIVREQNYQIDSVEMKHQLEKNIALLVQFITRLEADTFAKIRLIEAIFIGYQYDGISPLFVGIPTFLHMSQDARDILEVCVNIANDIQNEL